MAETKKNLFEYTEESIRSLDWKEHIRLRPGMYIGKLGDGSSPDDGIYVLVKEVIDNCIDEYTMGYGKTIEVTIKNKTVTIRDYGRGIPLGKVVDVVSKINTGAKYDSKVFQKSVGLNGVGTKAVNALSQNFLVQSFRDGKMKEASFEKGVLVNDPKESKSQDPGSIFMFKAFIINKSYPFLNDSFKHCLVMRLKFFGMRKKEISLAGHEIRYWHFFDPHQNITSRNIFSNLNAGKLILLITETPLIRMLHDDLNIVKILMKPFALCRCERHPFISRDLTFSY
jgi:DNA gyrase/topoisomerase IV subunit B